MRPVLGPGALGKPRGSGWRGRWEGGSGWGTHINPWLFHSNVWQNSLQIKKKKKQSKKKKKRKGANGAWRSGMLTYFWFIQDSPPQQRMIRPKWHQGKNPPAMQEMQKTWVQCLGQKDPLEEGMPTHSSILTWRVPQTKEPGGLQSTVKQRVRHE